MKKFIALILIVSLTAAPIAVHSQTAPSLVISEIGAFEISDNEWLTITNISDTEIDLSGWTFFENETNHGLTLARGDSPILAPGTSALIANKAESFATAYPEYTGILFDSSWSTLKLEGEQIGLKNAASEVMELFTYPQSPEATSLKRKNLQITGIESSNWEPAQTLSFRVTNTTPVVTDPSPVPQETPVAEETERPPENREPDPPAAAISPAIPATPTVSPPPNEPPVAVITLQSGSLVGTGTTTVNVSADGSRDPNSDPLTFAWDFGDQKTSSSANPGPHKYSTPGTYTLRLTVTDTGGLSNSTFVYVYVLPFATAPQITKIVQSESKSAAPQEKQITPALPQATTPLYIIGYFSLANSPPQNTSLFTQLAQFEASEITTLSEIQEPKEKIQSIKYSVRISEIYPAPPQGKEEWIEIWNTGNTPVNLQNWLIADVSKKKKPTKLKEEILIAPHNFAILPKSKTKISLNNNSDQVILADSNGTVIDRVAYSDAKKNASYSLVDTRGGGNWQWTPKVTPGKANPAYKTITGVIKKNLPEEKNLSLETEEDKIIEVDYRNTEELDPIFAQSAFAADNFVELQATEEGPTEYQMQHLKRVETPEKQQPQRQTIPWLMIFLATISIAANAPGLLKLWTTWKQKRSQQLHAPLHSAADGFDISKNDPLAM